VNRQPCRQRCRPVAEQLESRALLATFQVVNTTLDGVGSLGWAIRMANRHRGPDSITFNIPGTGTHNVPIQGNFGNGKITGQVSIDGYTQPGSAPNTSTNPAVNNARITVNIFSANIFGGSTLFVDGKHANGTTIFGVGIFNRERNPTDGVEVRNANFVTVTGSSFFATAGARLRNAVIINNGDNDTIGGTVAGTPALKNVMSGYNIGVDLRGSSQHNAIVSNVIGGDPGQSSDPLQKVGVQVARSSRQNTIVGNILFKNIKQISVESTNVIDDNTFVPR
jgi:Periplasmic copper-binding protein (NosD)